MAKNAIQSQIAYYNQATGKKYRNLPDAEKAFYAGKAAGTVVDVPVATTTVAGKVKKSATVAAFAGADVAGVVGELNGMLTKLKTAGLVA